MKNFGCNKNILIGDTKRNNQAYKYKNHLEKKGECEKSNLTY